MNDIEEILPEKPRKIQKDLSDDVEIFSEVAKLSKDKRNQYFVRFPRKISDALGFDNVDKIEFMVTILLPDAKPEESELTMRLIRK